MSSLWSRGPNATDRAYCSLEEPRNSQLTLANLGFKEGAQDDESELSRASPREVGRRLPRPRSEKAARMPPAAAHPPSAERSEKAARMPPAAAHPPSAEEMKRAALEASYILAGIAGKLIKKSKKVVDAEVAADSVRKVNLLRQQEEEITKEEEGKKEAEEEEEDNQRQSSFVGVEALESAEALLLDHPWSEWLEFLRELSTKGFFEGSEQGVEEGKHLFESYSAVRHAINAFGRSHPDIFNCLSRKDLKVFANVGCPDIDRKASNASKRLRAHFHIREGDVCQRCRLKMTCPRAFLAPESQLRVNTLDVVRIITGYATNSWPNADSYVSYPTEVGVSVCNLLREFLTYKILPRNSSEDEHLLTERLPVEPKKIARKKVESSPPVDPKPGDWTCPNCEFLNFSRNRRCRECQVCRPQRAKNAYIGDWHCPECRYLNFSKNSYCRECNFERQTTVKWMGAESLPNNHRAASDKLPIKEKSYEASDEEDTSEMCSMNAHGLNDPESDGTFSDEEERALSKGLSNIARKLTRPDFKWEVMEEEVEGLYDLRDTNKPLKVPQRTPKRGTGRASRRQHGSSLG
ncbi:hypothetical protein L7F22_041809 [Adiantum nelumboides]|nr:hypothetical protein [Adiantum nelumboides]